jgi:two-component system chemotaxis sensor kinase CheA
VSGPLDVSEFIAGYLAEAEELLSSSSANLLAVEDAQRRGQRLPKAVRELFRSLHTLKGLSAMVGAEPIVDIAHEMETLLRAGDRAGGVLPTDAVEVLVRGLRAIDERVSSLSRGAPLAAAPRALLDALAAFVVDAPEKRPVASGMRKELEEKLSPGERDEIARALAAGRRAVEIEFVPSLERSGRGINITSVRERVAKVGDIVKIIPRTVPAAGDKQASVAFLLIVVTAVSDAALAEAAGLPASEVVSLASTPAPAPAPAPEAAARDAPGALDALDDVERFDVTHKSNVVRVDVARLDDALDHLTALVVNRARLERAAKELARGEGSVRALLDVVAESGRQVRNLRASIMRARMVPVRDVLDRAPLIVRGLGKTSGKQVRLVLDVGNSELDKSVADRLFPAVVHLLRNAVDHALESADERKAAGKPEEGLIEVTCRARSDNQLELRVRDDGRGIDRVKVAARAGVAVPNNDDELLALVTRPGLSTRDAVSQTSGRGMGMDIAKRIVVDDLGGELRLETAKGQGTLFTFIVPLSVTILDVFSFRCGSTSFVVPVSSVDDLAEIDPKHVRQTPNARAGAAQLLLHRASTIPLFKLSTLLGVLADDEPPDGRRKAIIVRRNADVFGFEVDRLVGQQEVVVRPLQDPLVKMPGIAGSTDLGDGKPTLVLDLHALAQRASATGSSTA